MMFAFLMRPTPSMQDTSDYPSVVAKFNLNEILIDIAAI
jgi:hypothetical protein